MEYLVEVEIDDTKGIVLPNDEMFNLVINARKGNELKVSDLLPYKNGIFPGGSSKLDKRKMSSLVPKWNKDECIECGFCALYCPHAVIRPFVLNDDDKYANLGKDSNDNKKFIISVSEADCTGCGLCVKNCPKNCLTFGEYDEDKQLVANDLFENYHNMELPLNTIKNLELREPLFEFSGACAGCGETPYIKMLTQVVGKKLVIANATGCSSIYGASMPSMPYKVSWGNSLFEDNAEYAYGILNTYDKLRQRVLTILNDSVDEKELLDKINSSFNDYDKLLEIKKKIEKYIPSDLKDYILPKSV